MRRLIGKVAVLASVLLACAMSMSELATGMAQAAQSPSAYTGGTNTLTTSSVVLTGGVNPNGQATSYYFEYGQTAAYGAQTPTASAGGGTQVVGVTAPVGGLITYTAYHYRLVAVNPHGTTLGADHTFTTRRVPLTFTVSAAPSRDVFGSPFAVTGTLAGTGNANHELVLLASAFPFLASFKPLGAPVLTDANGNFSFHVSGLSQNTQLRVSTVETPASMSRVMVERVAVRVTLHVRSSGRPGFVVLYGTVSPAQAVAPVFFQMLRPGHNKPKGVARAQVKSAGHGVSRFERLVHIRHAGLYRAFVSVLTGGQVSNHSRAVLIR
jgi:hypothetical protein